MGCTFSRGGRDTKNTSHRVAQARKNNRCIKWDTVVKGHNKTGKKFMYKSMVKSALTYGAETWSLYGDDRRGINTTEMAALRRSARISKLDRKTNEYIREKRYGAG